MRKIALFALVALLASCSYVGNERHKAGSEDAPTPVGTESSTASSSASPSPGATSTVPDIEVSAVSTPASTKKGSASAFPTADVTPTETPPVTPDCNNEIYITSVAGKAKYKVGETVKIIVTAKNQTSHTCVVHLNKCFVTATVVNNWSSKASGQHCSGDTPKTLKKDESASMTFFWNQKKCNGEGCSGPSVKDGAYQSSGTWTVPTRTIYPSPTSFLIEK